MPVDTGVSLANAIGSNTPACIEMLCGPEVSSCNVVPERSFRALLRYCGVQPAVNVGTVHICVNNTAPREKQPELRKAIAFQRDLSTRPTLIR